MVMPSTPSYLVASTFVETCIFNTLTSEITQLPKKVPLTTCNQRMASSREFFKTLREYINPDVVAEIVIPYTEFEYAEPKQQILQNAQSYGYEHITLMSFETAAAIRVLRQSDVISMDGDVTIFLFHLTQQICATILLYEKGCWSPVKHVMTPVKLPRLELQNFCNNLIIDAPASSKLNNYIVGYIGEMYEKRKEFFKKIYDGVDIVDVMEPDENDVSGLLSGFLTKARILHGDVLLKDFDVASTSDYEFKAVWDTNETLFETIYEHLPFKKQVEIEIKPGIYLEFYKRHFISSDWIYHSTISVTNFSRITINLNVDINGIAEFKITEADQKKSSLPLSPSPQKPSLSSSRKFYSSAPKHVQSSVTLSTVKLPNEFFEFRFSANAISVIYNKNGKCNILKNEHKNPTTPAMICLHQKPPLVGEDAQAVYHQYPDYTVFDFIPMFGKKLLEIDVKPEWPFKVYSSKCNTFIEILFNTYKGPRRFPVSLLMTILIVRLKSIAEKQSGKECLEAVRITFDKDVKFSDVNLLKNVVKNANLNLIEE